ncbi:MAG: PEP-CTERM sorting domain-containing protein [Planctomycetes bacterium]|nr:PEP-CTERM sorting domain-containing protein [Planctomycetota bacterium]
MNDEWAHLVGTYDGDTQRFYINGQEVGNALVGQGFGPNDAEPLRIGGGATEGNGNFFFEGDIDEVAVYDTALSPERVLAHYEAGINPIPEPSTLVLSFLGLMGLLAARRRRKIVN